MSMLKSDIRIRLCSGFDDPAVSSTQWSELLRRGDTDTVNLTWHWQRAWWETFGRGRLLLLAAHRGEELVAVAPLFADGGMVFNICPEDHLDFVGDISEPEVLDAILNTARSHCENFVGFQFYFVPDTSQSAQRLQAAAVRLGLDCFCEAELPSPWLDIAHHRETAEGCTRKQSLLRHEKFFRRAGELQCEVLDDAGDVAPLLDDFFAQHIARRAVTPWPSLFCDPKQREYYRQLTDMSSARGWLRFARVLWNGRPIAYHFGLYYRERYLWGIPSFDVDLARHSPGEVLLRQVLVHAIAEGAGSFDFGPGDEAYKYRFATDTVQLQTWGLYPRAALVSES